MQPLALSSSEGSQVPPDVMQDVIDALANLGYNPNGVVDKVRSLCEPGMSSDTLLKRCLQSFSKV